MVDEVVSALAPGVSAALASSSTSAAASSTDPIPPPFPACGYTISDLGYVRCNRGGHDPTKTVGLVGWKTDGRSIFANCHLHPACSVSARITRQGIIREHLAEWLCKGQRPPPGMSREDRVQMGKEHPALFSGPPVM